MADGKKVLVLGATSAIAERWARLRAEAGDSLLLVARNAGKLAPIADDLKARGAARVETLATDLAEVSGQADRFASMVESLGGLDIALVAYGDLGDQDRSQQDPDFLEGVLRTNFTSAAIWCELIGAELERRGGGSLVAISSVAGDRGRRISYVYGAAKGGLSRYVEGMAHRFAGSKVHVLCVRPGLIDTPMTAHMDKGGPLWATPEKVAEDIDKAISAGRVLIYTPWFWRIIMLIVRHIPRVIFDKMNI